MGISGGERALLSKEKKRLVCLIWFTVRPQEIRARLLNIPHNVSSRQQPKSPAQPTGKLDAREHRGCRPPRGTRPAGRARWPAGCEPLGPGSGERVPPRSLPAPVSSALWFISSDLFRDDPPSRLNTRFAASPLVGVGGTQLKMRINIIVEEI